MVIPDILIIDGKYVLNELICPICIEFVNDPIETMFSAKIVFKSLNYVILIYFKFLLKILHRSRLQISFSIRFGIHYRSDANMFVAYHL